MDITDIQSTVTQHILSSPPSSAETGQCHRNFLVRDGDRVALPCQTVPDQDKCDWLDLQRKHSPADRPWADQWKCQNQISLADCCRQLFPGSKAGPSWGRRSVHLQTVRTSGCFSFMCLLWPVSISISTFFTTMTVGSWLLEFCLRQWPSRRTETRRPWAAPCPHMDLVTTKWCGCLTAASWNIQDHMWGRRSLPVPRLWPFFTCCQPFITFTHQALSRSPVRWPRVTRCNALPSVLRQVSLKSLPADGGFNMKQCVWVPLICSGAALTMKSMRTADEAQMELKGSESTFVFNCLYCFVHK